MNETLITLQGWLGADVKVREAGDSRVASFRVACTPRRFQRKTGEWGDADTQWYTVNAWRALAEHCERSLRRGDPVVLHGRLNATTWTNNAGIAVTSLEVDAFWVGHDLTRGTSVFTRAAGGPAAVSPTGAATTEVPTEVSTEAGDKAGDKAGDEVVETPAA